MNTNRIGVIGIGRLGLSFALLCEQSGYTVVGHDIRKEHIESLNNRTYTTTEPMLNEYLQRAPGFHATTNISLVVDSCDLLFCFVPTPSLPTGEYDHQYIEQVLQELEALSAGFDLLGKVLVIGCTVMPGYTASISDRLHAIGMTVAYNPEFIAQGVIVQGLKEADIVLIGVEEDSTYHMLSGVYRTIMSKVPNIRRMAPTAAEITKMAINCYLTTKISFANMIGEICINSGIEEEIQTVLQAIGDDSRIGNKFLGYGYGFSGVCLPRDNRALGVHAAAVSASTIIPRTIDTFNDFHHFYLRDYYIAKNPDKTLPFIFPYISYKRGTDILTESAPYRLCKELLHAGYNIHIEQDTENIVNTVRQELKKYHDKISFGTCTNGYRIYI